MKGFVGRSRIYSEVLERFVPSAEGFEPEVFLFVPYEDEDEARDYAHLFCVYVLSIPAEIAKSLVDTMTFDPYDELVDGDNPWSRWSAEGDPPP